MKIRTIRLYIREAVVGLIRNRLMSIASILTVASCLLVVSIFIVLATNIDAFMTQMGSGFEIVAFIEDELNADEVNALYTAITELQNIKTITYVPQEKAFEQLTEMFSDQRILEGLESADFLPRSFVIEIDDLPYQETVVAALIKMRDEGMGIGVIRYSGEAADVIIAMSNVLRVVCFSLIGLLASISIVIITNTIRITVNARKHEINIMKYIGATDWFIRWPFIIEGMLIGVFGGIIPVAVCWPGYNKLVETVPDKFPLISFFDFVPGNDIFFVISPLIVLLGVLIGVVGSVASISKHLKV